MTIRNRLGRRLRHRVLRNRLIYLAAEFVVTAGDHAKRKMWSNIGLHSKKGRPGPDGRSFIRAALNSARNVHPQDNSPQAAAARRIQGFRELDGLEFLARVDIEKDGGPDRNVVKIAVEPDHPGLRKLMACRPRLRAVDIPALWRRWLRLRIRHRLHNAHR